MRLFIYEKEIFLRNNIAQQLRYYKETIDPDNGFLVPLVECGLRGKFRSPSDRWCWTWSSILTKAIDLAYTYMLARRNMYTCAHERRRDSSFSSPQTLSALNTDIYARYLLHSCSELFRFSTQRSYLINHVYFAIIISLPPSLSIFFFSFSMVKEECIWEVS